MLRALGVNVSRPSSISGDNTGVISNATTPDATLKKKHVALSYHAVRESVSAGIIWPNQVSSKNNIADLLTKPFGSRSQYFHVSYRKSIEAQCG
jgi:hypothetical protein